MQWSGSIFWAEADPVTPPRRSLRLATSPGSCGSPSVEEALQDVAEGRMVVIAHDDGDAGAIGGLVMAAGEASAEDVTFMTRQAGGWMYVAVTSDRYRQLGLAAPPDAAATGDALPFAATVDARDGGGMSAAGQAHTMRAIAGPSTDAGDVSRPGHVRVRDAHHDGLLGHRGLAEAATDLVRLAGRTPAAVVCAVQGPDGSVARMPGLAAWCDAHDVKLVTLADVAAHRTRHEPLVERVVATAMPTRHGRFTSYGYRSLVDDHPYVAMVKGEVTGEEDVLVRVHHECLAGDVFHSVRCECRQRLTTALETIEAEGRGVVLYVSPGDHGAGRLDRREPAESAQILLDLGVRSARVPHQTGRVSPWDATAVGHVRHAG